jgi:CPA1 family monovalent cation:H+ antiporter
MPIFEYVLILLVAICLSNVVNRFLPIISVPIVQIALGALVTLLPLHFRLELNPSLFFVLFVAPLIFHISLLADKKTMWQQRKPILDMGIFLVFTTVFVVGYLVNLLIPSIPLVAAFVLIAALGPTDDVAVASVSKRVNVPPKIMNILQGESIINDASGITCFQFALAAMLTGSFSLVEATGRFFVIALGGIVVGLILSWLKYNLVQLIRSFGLENVTLHLLLGILTPFIVYLVAEGFEVSGILSVFVAGIAHSFNKDKFNPERVNHNIASESVWSMLSFTLEGLVFVILGTQLPQILASINQNYSITTWKIVSDVLLITLLFLFLRFVWSMATIKKSAYNDPEQLDDSKRAIQISRFKAGIIFSLSGARGAVTLASVMSIPLFLSDGTAFPERELIILIAGGVIVVSMLITSFILPLCVEKKAVPNKSAEDEAYLEILQKVILELKERITLENEAATDIIIANYHRRSIELKRKQNTELNHRQGNQCVNRNDEQKLMITIYEWEKENVLRMLECGETNEYAADHYLNFLDTNIGRLSKKRFTTFKKNITQFIHNHRKFGELNKHSGLREKVVELVLANTKFTIEKLKQMSQTDDNPVIRKVTADYESRLSLYQRHRQQDKELDNEILASVVSHSFQIERDYIQTMHEVGRISRETAKEMRHNISLLEVQLKKDYL